MGADFRTLNYLGSKFRLLSFIEDNVCKVTRKGAGVCDLFAGSGCVSYRLSQSFPVIACDIQHYSKVIANALLRKNNGIERKAKAFLRSASHTPLQAELLDVFKPLIDFEERAIANKDSTALTNVIEHGSVEVYNLEHPDSPLAGLLQKVGGDLRRHGLDNEKSLLSRYYGGVYFSYRQAVQMDAILECVFNQTVEGERDVYLAALLSAASDVVDTVGKHFAQPIRARDSRGNIKSVVCSKALKDKTVDITSAYSEWLGKYALLPRMENDSTAIQGESLDCLRELPDQIKTIYADPPYTREHYSRFYHVLETISLRDSPGVSTVTIHGETHVSNGIYRAKRYQSPFCIRSRAPMAFDRMFELAAAKGRNILLSYSPYDQTKQSHPRVVTIDQLVGIAEKYYKKVDIVSAGSFRHNKLNSIQNRLEASDEAELLIVSMHAR